MDILALVRGAFQSGTPDAPKWIVRTAIALILVAAMTRLAEGDGGPRRVGASARIVACSPTVRFLCDGLTSTRFGMNLLKIGWRSPGGLIYVGLYESDAIPLDSATWSQRFVGGAVRVPLGPAWFELGAGVGAEQVIPGSHRLTVNQFLDHGVLAVLGGIGTTYVDSSRRMFDVSLDVASSVESRSVPRIYQVTAGISTAL